MKAISSARRGDGRDLQIDNFFLFSCFTICMMRTCSNEHTSSRTSQKKNSKEKEKSEYVIEMKFVKIVHVIREYALSEWFTNNIIFYSAASSSPPALPFQICPLAFSPIIDNVFLLR